MIVQPQPKVTRLTKVLDSVDDDETMAEEWHERNNHPLLNDVILSKVFEYVRPRDLKECRVVSQKWNVFTIPFTRMTWKVTIYGDDQTECSMWGNVRDPRTIGKFMEVFSLNELGIPFATFQLGAFSMTDVVGQEYLRLCGKIAKEIDLRLGSQDFVVEDVSELLRSTPNLVKFQLPHTLHSMSGNVVELFPGPENSKPRLKFLRKLKSIGDSHIPESRIKFCPTFMEELFAAAENISHLFSVLTVIQKLGRESSIQSLHLTKITKEHVKILKRMKSNGMKLKKIRISDNFPRFKFIALAKIFKDTLRVFRAEWFTNSLMEFPKMPHLTWLTTYISNELELKFFNLSNIFPSLEKLGVALQFQGFKECDEFFSESDRCLKMKSLKIRSTSVRVTGFSRTLTLFPNLTELHLNLEMHGLVLRNIWTQMTQLEVLTLIGSIQTTGYLDSIFTGISVESLQEIELLVNELAEMTREVRVETISKLRNEHSRLPSLANLTNLRHLELNVNSSDDVHGAVYLTDLTGYLELCGMKELRQLNVGPSKLTKSCCEILTTDLGLKSWTFRGVGRGSIIPSVFY